MADPFEVRLRFTDLLSHLSASTSAAMKTAHYAFKHRDMSEDLHSCILENLERGHNMNNRANIMYFLEHHADVNLKEGGHVMYVEMVRRDIRRIVDAVSVSGANVKVCRRVVGSLGEKGVLGRDVVREIEHSLREKEERMGKLLGDDDEDGSDAADLPAEPATDATAGATVPGAATTATSAAGDAADSRKATPRTVRTNGHSKMDKKAIEQRIEEDRERNKRLRESVWAVPGDDDGDLDKMWDEGSELDDDEEDFVIADEEQEERRQFAHYAHDVIV